MVFGLYLSFMSVRWGKKYVDARDWRKCNQRLVDRGAFTMDPGILRSWAGDVEMKNRGKYGRPFLFPDRLFYVAAALHTIFHMPYRQIQGYFEELYKDTGVKVPDYTTFYKRIKDVRFDVFLTDKKKDY